METLKKGLDGIERIGKKYVLSFPPFADSSADRYSYDATYEKES